MIAALAALLGCQLAGEIIVRALRLPLPGPVLGLGFLFAFLLWRGRGTTDAQRQDDAVPAALGRVADAFLANLSLLFVPAAVGIVQYLDLLRQFALPIAVTVAVSTIATLMTTALVFGLVARLPPFRGGSAEKGTDPGRRS